MTTQGDATGGEQMKAIPRISVQAFCQTDGVAQALEAAARDRRMARTHTDVRRGGIDVALDLYASHPTPNLIFLECSGAPAATLADIDRLSEICDPGTKVIVAGHVNDVQLYRELTRRGVSEYMVAPFEMFDVIREIGEIYFNPSTPVHGQSIAVIGAKGGCGSSTVAHNLAWTITHMFKQDVAIADLDLPFGTAGLNFNQDPTQGLADVLAAPDRVDETFVDRLLTKCTEQLSILAAPATLDRMWEPTETAFDGVVDVLRTLVPVTVLDVPKGWSPWTKRVLGQADQVVLVVAPDLANLRNAKAIVEQLTLLRPNDGKPNLVINMAGVPKRPEIKSAEIAKTLGLEPVATIAFEPHGFGTAANNGQMLAEIEGRHAAAEAFRQIAQSVTGRIDSKKPKATARPLLARLLRRKTG